jgi:hypothetical protein
MENLSEKAKVMAESKFNYIDSDPWSGITKREYFAVLAMQGMLVNGGMTQGGSTTHSPNGISELAVLHADALLEALSKP